MKIAFLGRHHICRPLDPTLDIWSNFLEKRKKIGYLSLVTSSSVNVFWSHLNLFTWVISQVIDRVIAFPILIIQFHKVMTFSTNSFGLFFMENCTFFKKIKAQWVVGTKSSTSSSSMWWVYSETSCGFPFSLSYHFPSISLTKSPR